MDYKLKPVSIFSLTLSVKQLNLLNYQQIRWSKSDTQRADLIPKVSDVFPAFAKEMNISRAQTLLL